MVVRDCNPHYIDNMSGSRSYNHSAFGCSVASNTIKMVSNKKQFTNPALMDFPDAEKYNQSYSDYLKPSVKREVKEAKWSTSTSGK
jgi:type IV pilus biogenesis protein CpaD/CtpE